MTDDYKINLLNYVIGNIEPTPQTDEEIFKEQISIDRSKWVDFVPEHWNNFRFEGMVAGNELTSNLSVLYGGYLDTDNISHGIIILVNENFEPVKTIYNYNSGTELRYIQYMKQAEDGTFYFVDDAAFTYSQKQQVATSQKRFVMVNNFTLINQITNDYDIILRISYIFSGDYVNFYCQEIYKDPNSAHYIFFGDGANTEISSYSYTLLKIFGLKINVGEANEWVMYKTQINHIFGSAIAIFNSNSEVQFRCVATPTSTSQSAATILRCFEKTYSSSSVTINSFGNFSYKPYIDSINYKKQSLFISYDEVYFVQNNQLWGTYGVAGSKYIGLYKYNFNTSQITTIYEKYLGEYIYTNLEAMYITRNNIDIYVQYNPNYDINNSLADYYFQRLKNDEWDPILIAQQANFVYDQRTMFAKTNFNLLQVYLFATSPNSETWFQYLIKENYNTINYNGEPYIDYDCLIPRQGEIYSNEKLVFARNLYNDTINNNSSIATIQVPNSYLNNIDLSPKTLISQTNLVEINDTNVIQKNIYETLFLNYINTINVIDEDTNTQYPNAANYINTNINVGAQTNYNNSNVGKIKINTNSETKTQSIYWESIDDTHYQTMFTLYVDEIITTLDFISYDETTTYCTKDLSNLEVGKTYTITQCIRVE